MNTQIRTFAVVVGLAAWACIACALVGSAAGSTPANCLQFGEPLKHWLVLKPIPVMSDKNRAADDTARHQAFSRDWLVSIGGEAGVRPQLGAKLRIAGHALKWSNLEADRGSADLHVRGHPVDDALAYAWTEFEVPEDKSAVLGIGSDDAVKVWLNGKLVHTNWVNRPVHLDEDLVLVELRAGKNRILLKVQNSTAAWGFACRVLSPEQAEGLRLARAEMGNPASGTLTDEQIKTALRDYIDTDRMGVGMVVGIVDEHGTQVVSQGKLSNTSNREVDGDTLFEIGSVTKVFTALLLQDMVERREMRLEDPVKKYLPNSVTMPTYDGKEVTLLHLATHTSGLPRDVGNMKPQSWRRPEEGYTVEQFYAFLSGCKLRNAPGMKEEYSNLGLELLGHLVALKAGKDYQTLVLERICVPLRMDSTRISLTPELKVRLATGHVLPGAPVCSEDFSILPAAGAIKSTAHDLLKFILAYSGLTDSPLRAVMDKAEAEHALESGGKRRLVWFGNGSLFEHGGMTFGHKTELAFDTSKKRGIVFLSNCSSGALLSDSWRGLLEGRPRMPANIAPLRPGLYDRYVGLYETDKRARCAVRRDGDRFMVQWLGTPEQRVRNYSFEVFAQSDSVFRNKPWHNQLVQVCFVPNGNDSNMILSTSEFCLEARKISSEVPKTPEPVRLAADVCERYVGRYRMALLGLIPVGPTLNILHESDKVGEHLIAYLSGSNARAFLDRLGGGLAGGELFPENETTFFTPFSDVEVRGTFVRNKKGKTTGIVIDLGGTRIKGVRVGNTARTQ
jgi:serine-type D-Ala-D-Ala carboxypeptidase/endopeptidase